MNTRRYHKLSMRHAQRAGMALLAAIHLAAGVVHFYLSKNPLCYPGALLALAALIIFIVEFREAGRCYELATRWFPANPNQEEPKL